MEPFKNIFNKKSVKNLSNQIATQAKKSFDQKNFIRQVNNTLETLEMKDRVRLISQSLKSSLNGTYIENIDFLIASLADDKNEDGPFGFMVWPLLQYVEDYGLEDFDTSFMAMYEMTQRFSAEFTIRPYLIKDDKTVFKILKKWQKDPNHHIRRLCSEGTRPNLPWGLKVHSLNENLERNLELIDRLKDDPEEYVRRSVANHLNDISRIDQKLMLSTADKWSKGNPPPERVWVVRHATRSLLKQGHPKALKLHGYNPKAKLTLSKIKLDKKKIREGDHLTVSGELSNSNKNQQKILVEYIIHYLKKDGSYSKKQFRMKDTSIEGGESMPLEKKIHFKKVTTRKHYKGIHKVSLQVNGVETKCIHFKLD